jgi:hypothetical protein
VTTPWVAIASANARSSALPSSAAAPIKSQQTSDTGGVSLTGSPPSAGLSLVLVDRRGLSPQVELGPVGLDLTPDGKRTESEQHDYQ